MELFCEECDAQWPSECVHVDNTETLGNERWVSIEGHAMIGDPRRASLAQHDTENCRCPQGQHFDPESWY